MHVGVCPGVYIYSIGVGRCYDFGGGGDIFFKQQKYDFIYNTVQYCNEVHYVNSG